MKCYGIDILVAMTGWNYNATVNSGSLWWGYVRTVWLIKHNNRYCCIITCYSQGKPNFKSTGLCITGAKPAGLCTDFIMRFSDCCSRMSPKNTEKTFRSSSNFGFQKLSNVTKKDKRRVLIVFFFSYCRMKKFWKTFFKNTTMSE